ncbi:hypothetical protein Y1Q_0016741 [Alligator mississippiensis]|uniref:Uncharacterized protein n=1 Tax=Alligator mississippiensis TaxID=8496 RepID=A0A151P5U3_ALLMI|nr:hypothetical protein Y1Q_0016741 [Alligator mississippiensis]
MRAQVMPKEVQVDAMFPVTTLRGFQHFRAPRNQPEVNMKLEYTSALPFDLKSNYSVALEEKHLEAK